MKKPTATQFFIGYGLFFVLVQVAVCWSLAGTSLPAIFLTMSFVNILFIIVHLIATAFAIFGHVPWRHAR